MQTSRLRSSLRQGYEDFELVHKVRREGGLSFPGFSFLYFLILN